MEIHVNATVQAIERKHHERLAQGAVDIDSSALLRSLHYIIDSKNNSIDTQDFVAAVEWRDEQRNVIAALAGFGLQQPGAINDVAVRPGNYGKPNNELEPYVEVTGTDNLDVVNIYKKTTSVNTDEEGNKSVVIESDNLPRANYTFEELEAAIELAPSVDINKISSGYEVVGTMYIDPQFEFKIFKNADGAFVKSIVPKYWQSKSFFPQPQHNDDGFVSPDIFDFSSAMSAPEQIVDEVDRNMMRTYLAADPNATLKDLVDYVQFKNRHKQPRTSRWHLMAEQLLDETLDS